MAITKKKLSKKAKPVRKSSKTPSHPKRAKLKPQVNLEVPHYPQTEEFTSSAACAMMVLKFMNKNFKLSKEQEYGIWQEAVNGSVWHGSKYGIAYALAKRGARVKIISNTKDEGYDRKLAVYENVNLDTLTASFNEIKGKAISMKCGVNFAFANREMITHMIRGQNPSSACYQARSERWRRYDRRAS